MFAGRSVGAWGDAKWIVGDTAQLVEGGGNGPYWETSPGGHHSNGATPESMLTGSADGKILAKSLLLLVAATVWNTDVQEALVNTELVSGVEGRRCIAKSWNLSDTLTRQLADALSPAVRIGIVRLDDDCALNGEATGLLRDLGFTVDEFVSTVTATV